MAIQLTSKFNVPVNLNSVTHSDIAAFVQSAMANKGQFGVQLVTITDEHRLQKKNLATILGKKVEVKKMTEVSNAMFGWDYERVVKARAAREGGDPSSFTAEAPFGKTWVKNFYGILLESNKNPGVEYLRSYQSKATKYRSIYLVDGKIATQAEDTAIRQCLRDSNPSHKQHEAGISEENEVMPRDYTISNIYGMFCRKWGVNFGMTFDTIVQSL